MPLEIHAATDIGLRRAQNEDHYATWVPDDPAVLEQRGVLLVLADGMGGSLAGEIASHLAVDSVLESWRAAPGSDVAAELRAAVVAANRAVFEESRAHPDRRGMGTTLTVAVARGGRVHLAHVGDSRAYLLRGPRLIQLTRDHSLVAQLVEDRHLTPEQARVDPRRNVVTRSVGVGPEVEIDVVELPEPLQDGDRLLLSSDGLHGLVEDPQIAELASEQDMGVACERLVEAAKAHGGHDNITVILARLDAGGTGATPEAGARSTAEPAPAPAPGRNGASHPTRGLARWLLALAGIAALLALLRLLGTPPTALPER